MEFFEDMTREQLIAVATRLRERCDEWADINASADREAKRWKARYAEACRDLQAIVHAELVRVKLRRK